jgi:putative flippase GtrA
MHNKQKITKYLTNGVVTFLVEYCSFLLFVYVLSFEVWWGQLFSYCIAIVINFLLLKLWVFKNLHRKNAHLEMIKYGCLIVFNLPVSVFLITQLSLLGVKAFIAKFIVVCVTVSWNYVVYDKVIFKRKSI